MEHQQESMGESKSPAKPPVVRGARACTVCRAAKMKCVGAEDGQKQCQRCKRANAECVFEKHRRGRKPGSRLSEASKVLRRLEKGLNSAKLKSHSAETTMVSPYSLSDSRNGGAHDSHYSGIPRPGDSPYSSPTHMPSHELPPLNNPSYPTGDDYPASSNGSHSIDMDEDEEDPDRTDEGLFPAKLIRKENQRNSYFRTVLHPNETPMMSTAGQPHGSSFPPPQPRAAPIPNGLNDPITAGLIDEDGAKVLFDLVFLRLNPFINLFDPALHTVPYVRSKCPFLFTTLIMAGCKFFKPELFKSCQKLANDFAVRAFAESWKRVEVVQAFACLTYWKDPDDSRTWTYIGYACRMAVELNLNRHVPHPPPHETEFQMRERRNRERTYLVLFIHDRSLSTQTGRHWMLPEDDLVRYSSTWHEEGGSSIRAEDVIVAGFVQLRRIAAETTDMFYSSKGSIPGINHNDVNYEVVLRNCNGKLTQWMDTWKREMQNAGGESFHFAFLSFFRLYVRLFLNSFGIQASMSPASRTSPSLQALSACFTSGLDSLQIVYNEFASMSMLRYGQDSITVMSAYSAIFLLKLLRSSSTLTQLHEGAAHEIHTVISKTADAYHDASVLSPASTSAAYHARFLRSLVTTDIFKARRNDKERYDTGMPIDPLLRGPPGSHGSIQMSSAHIYRHQVPQIHEQSFHFPASPHLPAHPSAHGEYPSDPSVKVSNGVGGSAPVYHQGVPHASELDAHYWKNMFLELGFGENVEQQPHGPGLPPSDDTYNMQQYGNISQQQHHHHSAQHHAQVSYHPMHASTQPGYNH